MSSIVITVEKLIARPIEVVRTQFVDMRHHLAAGVHPSLNISELSQDGDVCRFTSRRQVLGATHVNQIELERFADGNSRLRSVAGNSAGLTIDQRFEAAGDDRTRVRLTIDMPVSGLMRLLAPLVRKKLIRDTEQSLEEDRRDLEEGGYTPAG